MAARIFANKLIDARPDKFDPRDRFYAPRLIRPDDAYPVMDDIAEYFDLYTNKFDLILDQGREGACTGFGLAAVINYLLFLRDAPRLDDAKKLKSAERVSPWMIYQLARRYDEWPGEDYEGSSCRGAMKGWFHHGVCREDLWPNARGGRRPKPRETAPWQSDAPKRPLGAYYRVDATSVADMQSAIFEVGAIYCSASVHAGWDIDATKAIRTLKWRHGAPKTGGHAFALVGYDETGFIVQNSWGPKWGFHGFARVTYADWLANGDDAWVAMLGARIKGVAPDVVLSSSRGAARLAPAAVRGLANGATNATVSQAPGQHRWSLGETLDHALVVGHLGKGETTLVSETASSESARRVLFDNPNDWFGKLPPASPKRLAVYFHGGLNSLDDGLVRTSVLGPCFLDNGVYPVFVDWRSGVMETIGDILESAHPTPGVGPSPEGPAGDVLGRLGRIASDVLDRVLEAGAAPLGSSLWNNMKSRCLAAAQPDGASYKVAECVADLVKTHPQLELHLVGHSAGSIMIGALLAVLGRRGVKVKTCSLYAPACTVEFAAQTYIKAFDSQVLAPKSVAIDLLSDGNEEADTVGPYGKSLLYLVSRSFEKHKTPILGMEAVWNPDLDEQGIFVDEAARLNPIITKWRGAWAGDPPRVLASPSIVTGQGASQRSVHGCFDNWIEGVSKTLNRIRAEPQGTRLPRPIRSLEY